MSFEAYTRVLDRVIPKDGDAKERCKEVLSRLVIRYEESLGERRAEYPEERRGHGFYETSYNGQTPYGGLLRYQASQDPSDRVLHLQKPDSGYATMKVATPPQGGALTLRSSREVRQTGSMQTASPSKGSRVSTKTAFDDIEFDFEDHLESDAEERLRQLQDSVDQKSEAVNEVIREYQRGHAALVQALKAKGVKQSVMLQDALEACRTLPDPDKFFEANGMRLPSKPKAGSPQVKGGKETSAASGGAGGGKPGPAAASGGAAGGKPGPAAASGGAAGGEPESAEDSE